MEPEFEVNIDFNLASISWRENKKYIGGGMFEYKKLKCCVIMSNGKKCNRNNCRSGVHIKKRNNIDLVN